MALYILEEDMKDRIELVTKNVINLSFNDDAILVISRTNTIAKEMLSILLEFDRDIKFSTTSVGIIMDDINELIYSFTNYCDYSSSERLHCLKILRHTRRCFKMYDEKYEYLTNKIDKILGI